MVCHQLFLNSCTMDNRWCWSLLQLSQGNEQKYTHWTHNHDSLSLRGRFKLVCLLMDSGRKSASCGKQNMQITKKGLLVLYLLEN